MASALMPAAAAISAIGFIVAFCAISRSLSAAGPADGAAAADPGIVVSDIVVLWLVAAVGVPACGFRPLVSGLRFRRRACGPAEWSGFQSTGSARCGSSPA